MYSINNDGKSVIAERFIRTLKIKLINTWHQYQKMCILINQMILLRNTIILIIYQLKKKPVDIKDNTYIDVKK